MASDADWVEDVKRWTSHDGAGGFAGDAADEIALGVEAAQPALQARHWPEALTTDR